MTQPQPHAQPHPSPAGRAVLTVSPLSASSFAPFGDLIQVTADAPSKTINAGYARRFDDLARINTGHAGGHASFTIYRAAPRQLPLQLSVMERHVLGSQLFMPLASQRFLVVVAAAGSPPRLDDLHVFLVEHGQGVNLARGTWHHPLLALEGGDFMVIARGGPGADTDCEEHALQVPEVWIDAV